jgi:tetratricopeptide (TPR) repeat protein
MIRRALAAMLLSWTALAGAVRAGGDGQDALDRATDAKLNAERAADLDEVVRLAESALKKGLDADNTDFAQKLLVSTLMQRAQETVKQLLIRQFTPDDFRERRTLAQNDLERVVALDSKQPEALLLVGQLNLLPGGDPKKARASVDKALTLKFEDPAAHARALVFRSNLQQTPEKKRADLDEAVRVAPHDAAAVRARGLLLADMNQADAALADLDRAIELDPEDGPTYETKAIVLARLGKFDKSLAALDKAQELSPKSLMPLLQRARVHLQQEKIDAALDDLDQALTKDINNVAALLLRSGIYQLKGDKARALADVDRALRRRPDLPLAIRTRATLLAEDNRFDEALAELEKLHKLDPKDPLTLLQLGMVQSVLKRSADAIESFSALLAIVPNEKQALHWRGDAYLNLGRQAEAVADYEKSVKLDPKNDLLLNNYAWVLATSPDEKLRDGKRAIQLAKQACELTKYKAPHVLSTLAAAYAETGDFDAAIEWSIKANELVDEVRDPDDRESLKKELESYKARKPIREALPESGKRAGTTAPTENRPEAKPEAKPGKNASAAP